MIAHIFPGTRLCTPHGLRPITTEGYGEDGRRLT